MLIDQNERYITCRVKDLNGNKLTEGCIPRKSFTRALTHKKMVENLQKKYNKSWRFIPKVIKRVRKHHERARNITTDEAHIIANRLISIAREYNAWIVDENLEGMKQNIEQSRDVKMRWKVKHMCYRKLQHCLKYKAILNGIYFFTVDSKGNSSTCPRCGSKLKDINYKLKYCPKCNYINHRDFIALENIFKKAVSKLPEVFKEIENAWKKREKLREVGKKGRMKQLLSRECASPVLRGGANASEGDENPIPMKGNSRETKLHQQNIPGETLL